MSNLYIALIYHSIVHSSFYFLMTKKPLHLFNRHTFVNGSCRKCSAELMWMNLAYLSLFSKIADNTLYRSDSQPCMRGIFGYKQCRIIIDTLFKIFL